MEEKILTKKITNNNSYYVYEYFDPETDKVFYVGKGTGPRMFQHVVVVGEDKKSKKIKLLLKKYKPIEIARKIRINLTEQEAYSLEAHKIEKYGLHNLTNRVGGLLKYKRVPVPGVDVCIMESYDDFKSYKYGLATALTSKLLELPVFQDGGYLAQHGWHVEKDNFINISGVSFKLTVVVHFNSSRIQIDTPKTLVADKIVEELSHLLKLKPAKNTMYSRLYTKITAGSLNPEKLPNLITAIDNFVYSLEISYKKLKEKNRIMKIISGKKLNEEWGVEAEHALAHKDGEWYHYLERFPGALFDTNGYVVFNTNKDYARNKYLVFGEDVHVPNLISNMPGYIKVK